MRATKRVIGQLEKCYALGRFAYDGAEHLVVAAEKHNPCYTFDLDGNMADTLWEGPGGVMTVAQVPGKPILLATQAFYSPNDSAEAKIVYVRKVEGAWRSEILCDLPFVHRFGVLHRGGRHYLIACTLKSAHAFKNDWTCPGRIWVAPLPEDVTVYNQAHPLRLEPLVSGLTRNHGFAIAEADGSTFALVGSDNGVLKVTPPAEPDGDWQTEQLLDSPTSDVLYLDFDDDGERELLVLSPFHGDTLTIYKKRDGRFEPVYHHDKKLPFLHAIWGAEIGGRVCGFIGNREDTRDLIAIYWDADAGKYVYDLLDQGAGAANVMAFRNGSTDCLLAANRETNEIAIYELTE